MKIFFSVFLLKLFPYLVPVCKCARELPGNSNFPQNHTFDDEYARDELSYPYLNVYYNYKPKDWHHISDEHTKFIQLRRRLKALRQQISSDINKVNSFLDIQKNLISHAKVQLFRKSIANNILKDNLNRTRNNKTGGNDTPLPPRFMQGHDQEATDAIPSIDVNEIDYNGLLASQYH